MDDFDLGLDDLALDDAPTEEPTESATVATIEDDLAEAEERLRARSRAAQESVDFERQIQRVLNPRPALAGEDADLTPFEKRLAEIPVGSPDFEALAAELAWIARDRVDAARAKAAELARLGQVESPDDSAELRWDARDLSSADFAAFVRGDAFPPVGSPYTPRAWRELRAIATGAR
jgi:hypothetical protein